MNTSNTMNTTLATKVGALMLALAINGVIMGSVALMFNTKAHALTSMEVATSVAQPGAHIDRSAV